jgi:hypothetical protein
MIVRYTYENYSIKYSDGVLKIMCILDGVGYTREYDIPNIDHINIVGEYLFLTKEHEIKFTQFKFESKNEVVGDLMSADGEFLDSFACHDFYDDVKEI